MSKRKAGQRRRPQARPSPRRGRIKSVVIAAVLCVAAAGAVAARWRSLRPAHAPAPAAAVTAAVQSPPAFAPERPSKEYVYAGSRLVATEEPAVKSDQSITFDAVPNKTYGDPAFALSAAASSGLPVSFSVTSGPATVSGNVVTINGAGAVTVQAHQAGSDTFNPAPSVTRSFDVAKAGQTISFNATQLTGKTYGDVPFAVTASSSSGLPVAFTATGGVAVSGNTVTINAAGAASVMASAAGDSNHHAAADVEHSFTVAKAAAAVTLGSLSHTYDGAAKSAVVSTSPAGLPVALSYTREGSPVAGPIDAGSYSVTATVNDSNYQGAASGTLVINKAQATLTLGSLSQTYNGSPCGVAVTTSPAGLNVVSVTYNGSASAPTNAGSYAVVASLANSNYTAANATGTLVVAKGTPSINWADPADITYGTPLGGAQLNPLCTCIGTNSRSA